MTSTSLPGVGFEVRDLPWILRAPTRLTAMLGVDAPRLTPEHITRSAARAAGLPARFPAHVDEALEHLCRSYRDDAGLHWFGRMNQWHLLMTGLSTLLRIEDLFRRQPELDDTPLVAPLIVTGLPRSGTTFLHRLLSVPADTHAITLAEHIYPMWTGSPMTRRADVEARFLPWRWASEPYHLDAIHFVRPTLPDECNFGMRLAARSMIYWATAPTYGYLRWLLQQDLFESYRLYRRVLQLHQLANPGKRIVLKCPHHLAWLPALQAALPEALVVQTHRDPVQAVPSEVNLVLSLQAISTHRIDWRQTTEHNQLKVQTYADRAVAFHDTDDEGFVLHLDYRRLVDDPLEVVRQVRAHFGLDFDAAEAARTVAFIADNRQHKHGKHRYSREQFELTTEGIAERFADYRERFILDGVPEARPRRASA